MSQLWHKRVLGLRWLHLVAGLVAVALLTSLGQWQLRRADQKIAVQARIGRALAEPPRDIASGAAPTDLYWHRVMAHGRWRRDDVVYLDNRPRDGRVGVYVLMALSLDDGRTLIVNRGWLARDAGDRKRLAPYSTPAAEVTVVGVALADEPRLFDLGGVGAQVRGGLWQNFDFAAFARDTGVAPIALIVREENAEADGLERDWPDFGAPLEAMIERHHGYAVQWFAMAAMLAALLIFYGIRNVRNASA